MAGSRAAAEDQNTNHTAEELTYGYAVKERIKSLFTNHGKKMIDKIPGDKGSTVDKTRERNKKTKEAIDGEY